MALIKCQECSKEISSKASSCPHCGFKLQSNGGCLKVIGYFFVIIFALMMIGQCMRNRDSSTHILGNKELPFTGTYSCIKPKVAHSAKSRSGTLNDIVDSGVVASIQITDTNLFLDVNVNGFNQPSKPIPYTLEGEKLIAKSPLKDEQVVDPTTNSPWIRSRSEVVSINLKTYEMSRIVKNESLGLDRKVTGYETFTLTAKCPLRFK